MSISGDQCSPSQVSHLHPKLSGFPFFPVFPFPFLHERLTRSTKMGLVPAGGRTMHFVILGGVRLVATAAGKAVRAISPEMG